MNVMEDNTAWNQKASRNYETIQEQRSQAFEIQKITKGKDKVYFLNQQSTKLDEFGNNPALFYLDRQISDVRSMPWRYMEGGSIVRLDENNYFMLNGFPDLLTSGNFKYLWIYKTDDYLNRYLPLTLEMPTKSYAITSKEKDVKDSDQTEESEDADAADESSEDAVYEEGDNPAGILDGQLYKVIYDEEGRAKGLELTENLRPYDIRAEHKSVDLK
jgi:hypothetical protein